MSDILNTAKLYNKGNTFRSDTAGSTKGNARKDDGSIGFDCSGLVYHVLRESGYNVPYAASSVMQSEGNFTGSWATTAKESAVSPGTLVYFNGHVGIVNSYNPETKTGTFLSMTGKNNEGSLKPEEPFTTDKENKNPNITWGKTTAFKGFATVNQDLYDPQLDQHANGANANTPVFNIPEHPSSRFVTLPQNGGFPTIKESKDLSTTERILLANQGVTPLFGLEAAVGTTPFAKTLAYLESRDTPNDGYTVQTRDKDAKGNVLPGIGAIGRYGFRAGSLKAIGWMDDKGEWTDAAKAQGIDSVSTFQGNPDAQENARVAYIQVLKGELRNNGAWDKIGTTVNGAEVTEAGLVAAAWKEGSGAVGKYFNGHSTNANADKNIMFRLGEFDDVPIGTPHGTGIENGVASISAPTDSPRTPYQSNGTTTTHHTKDGEFDGVTSNYTAKHDSTNFGITVAKDDEVTYVQDAERKTIYFKVSHTVGQKTTVDEYSINPDTGETVRSTSEWAGGSLVQQDQYNVDAHRIGDRYIRDGEVYIRSTDQDGKTQWLNERNQTEQEWRLDPTNPLGVNAVNGSDLQSDQYRPPENANGNGTATKIAYQTVERDGNTYEVTANGTYDRAVSGHPGWTESRDSTGGGVILDREGAVMAQLQPGDRVGMMDDGRIAIDDRNGSSVNRTVDEAQAGAFYQHPSSTSIGDAALEQLVDAFSNIDTSQTGPGVQYADAGNGGVASSGSSDTSASNQPAATVEPAQSAPETIAGPNDYATYLAGAGTNLTPAQQDTLAAQLDQLGLGGANGSDALSFYPLPAGGVLIGNADGDIVGELSISQTGEVRLQANTVNADGTAGTQDLHISASGASTSHAAVVTTQMQAVYDQAVFNAAANDAAGGLNLLNSLANLAHFDQLTDLGKLQSLVSLYNQIDGLGSASAALTGTSSTGGNLPGDLGQWGAGLGLISALQGNDPIAQASASASLYNTFVSSSNAIPVPYIQALNLIGAIESGNTVSMIASVVAFIPGWGTALSLAITILAPLFADKPPPPEGATHFEWDDQGNIQIRVDKNQSHGGEIAQNTATSVQSLLQSMVQSINDQTEDTSDNVALNPYLLPKVGFSKEGAWIEISQPDGGAFREHIQGNNLAQRLFDILSDNGGIAPEWQVQTQLGHMHQLLAQGAGQGEISAELGAGAGGHAHAGNQAYALQGNAAEAADYKTQSYGALVVKVQNSEDVQTCQDALAQQLQAQVAITEIYKDVENDGYFESTQWVSATDAQGRLQGLLVVDFDGNGMIETRDVLNLGGNTAEQGNASVEATQANSHADLQRNNVQWLDANGDHVLDAHDPAFAAIKLWVDRNQDALITATAVVISANESQWKTAA